MGQSTNDVFPTATRLALLIGMRPLVDAARGLASALQEKADAFAHVLKVGRTHLQDAVPMTLGQEFGGYAACIERGADDVEQASEQLKELNLGATAVGTGLNAGDDYTRLAVSNLARSLATRCQAGRESVPRHAEHGRYRRLLGRDAAPGRGAREGRERSATAEQRTSRRASRRSLFRPCSRDRRSCRAR